MIILINTQIYTCRILKSIKFWEVEERFFGSRTVTINHWKYVTCFTHVAQMYEEVFVPKWITPPENSSKRFRKELPLFDFLSYLNLNWLGYNFNLLKNIRSSHYCPRFKIPLFIVTYFRNDIVFNYKALSGRKSF